MAPAPHAEAALGPGAHPPPAAPASPSTVTYPEWTDVTNNASLSVGVRSLFPMVYDPQLHGIVLFGGYDPYGSPYGDTWLFQNGSWSKLTFTTSTPAGRWGASLVYDPAGPYLLLFGGRDLSAFYNDTWALNSTGWYNLNPASAPSVRGFAASFYDPILSRVVVFGGACLFCTGSWVGYNDTWYFNGTDWANVTANLTGGSPPTNSNAYAAWDPAANAAILFGGQVTAGTCGTYSTTWTFARGWNLTHPATTPGAWSGGGWTYINSTGQFMIYNALFGTSPACWTSDSTWVYGNGSWVNITNAIGGPSIGSGACCSSLAYNPTQNYVLDFGGTNYVSGSYLDQTWLLTPQPIYPAITASPLGGAAPLNVTLNATVAGTGGPYTYTWTFGDGSANGTGATLIHRYATPGTYRITLFVNNSTGVNATSFQEVQVWGNAHWSNVGGLSPPPLWGASMAYDPVFGGLVLVGGLGYNPTSNFSTGAFWETVTWLFADGNWTNLTSAFPGPTTVRRAASLVWDPADQYLVYFGGDNQSVLYNDTWSINGTGWHLLTTPVAPSPRFDAATFYDPTLGETVLFGGAARSLSGPTSLADTWYFKAGKWRDVTSSLTKSPPADAFAATTWDPAVPGEIVYGGASDGVTCGNSGERSSTWVFDTGWNQSSPATNPGPIGLAVADYDSVLGETILFGGVGGTPYNCQYLAAEWNYTSSTWSNFSAYFDPNLSQPSARDEAVMAFDPVAKVSVLFGGNSPSAPFAGYNDTWTYPVAPLRATAGAVATRGTAPFHVTFRSTAAGGGGNYTYNWSFGDGTPNGTNATPIHSYATPGTYPVSLALRDGVDRLVYANFTIDVYLPLAAAANASKSTGEVPFVVRFTASETGGAGPYRYAWVFGDGGSSFAASPTYTYLTAGDYLAMLTVTDSLGDTASSSVPVNVDATLIATVAATWYRGTTPFVDQFQVSLSGGQGVFQENWSLGGGQYQNGTAGFARYSTANASYSASGTYRVSVVVNDSLGYSSTSSLSILVAAPLAGLLSTGGDSLGVVPYPVPFQVNATGGFPAYAYVWNFGDGSPTYSGGSAFPHTYVAAGTFTATVNITDSNGDYVLATTVVNVVAPLGVTIVESAATADAPANLSFLPLPAGGFGPFTYL